ncbi:response regulator [Noviherbaspirillum soli]|uniref:response regulator n=1 Tax=Noviherbaspirillum soli TaxID=1064518 RepID=UPI00188D3212|nr:response regulator [Noviherbaspirillum soli]
MEPPFSSISEQQEQPRERLLLTTLAAFCSGDLSARMPPAEDAASGKLAAEVDRWLDAASSVLRAFDRVVTDIIEGRFEQPMPLEVNGHSLRGPLLELAERINRMRTRLVRMTSEMGRIAHEVGVEGRLGGQAALAGPEGAWRDLSNHVNSLVTRLTAQVRAMSEVTSAMAKGDFSVDLQMAARGELAQLRDNINALIRSLRENKHHNAEQDWLKTNVARLTKQLQEQRSIAAMAGMLMSELAPLINIQQGLFYLMDDVHLGQPRMRLYASYAAALETRPEWRLGEGLIGQCALDREPLLITDVPPGYLTVRTGIGAAAPCCLLIQPILFEGEIRAVLELASFSVFTAIQRSFLTQLAESTGIVLHTIASSTRTENLLRQAQSLAQELQSQQEALSKSNAELHEKAVLLERQKAAMEAKNCEVEMTRMSLEEKAEQLMLSSRYKSEFLSNMSHELRTPLNSLLILARQLSENAEGNLTSRQVEYAETIYSAGGDLLGMINEILDLAKIESGTVVLDQRDVSFSALEEQVLRMFNPVAQSRRLDFSVTRSPSLPATIRTDEIRLLQVIRNLLSNAFKFTEHGGVTLAIKPVSGGWRAGQPALDAAGMVIAFKISDTGIGVAPQQQELIFEAFRQADTGTSRRYGGTGLGLSISTDLARLMHGELRLLRSEPGKGSCFALYVPLQPRQAIASDGASSIKAAAVPALAATAPIDSDDRDRLAPGDRVLLLIGAAAESGAAFLVAAHAHGCPGLVAQRGADGLDLLKRHAPCAIVLDAHLLDVDGWRLLAAIKRDDSIRHLPLHVVCAPGDAMRARQEGASACSSPPSADSMRTIVPALLRKAARRRRRLLLIGDDAAALDRLQGQLAGDDLLVRLSRLSGLPSALRRRTDCIVLHLAGADARPALALHAARQHGVNSQSPVLVYMPHGLPSEALHALLDLERQALVCRIHTEDRLLDDSALFLHRDLAAMRQPRQQRIGALHQGSHALNGRTVLIVDDDIRNVFALTGMLEHHGMAVCSAENGREAVDLLHERQACDIVLMDIMMPDMDGFDTMREIRRHAVFDALPIIALTAKAMKGDRDKCLAAGATDYVSKPVDIEELLALMRRRLHR